MRGKLSLKIAIGNEAMQTGADMAKALHNVEVAIMAKALHNVEVAIGFGEREGRIRDFNGNTVGSWKIEEEK